MGRAGPEPALVSGKDANSLGYRTAEGDASGDAALRCKEPQADDLREIVRLWPSLPESVRGLILAAARGSVK